VNEAISGRAHPEAEKNDGELSRDFKWGFGRRGVFYGWPSGHSMGNIGNTFYREKVGKSGNANSEPKFTIAPLLYNDHKGAVVSVRL
jgi:hypothetical protein